MAVSEKDKLNLGSPTIDVSPERAAERLISELKCSLDSAQKLIIDGDLHDPEVRSLIVRLAQSSIVAVDTIGDLYSK